MEIIECPECGKEFEPHRYGFGIYCPYCRARLDIFDDEAIVFETEWGKISISGLDKIIGGLFR